MERLPTLCRRTFVLKNLKRIVNLNPKSCTGPLASPSRSMGGGPVPANWKPLKQVMMENKSHMDFLPVPSGSWAEYHAAKNAKYNMYIAVGVVACTVTYAFLYKKGLLTLETGFPLKDFKYYDEKYGESNPNPSDGSGAGPVAALAAAVVEENVNNNAVESEVEVHEEVVAETPAPEEKETETPAPEETVAETPAPEEAVAETPAPEETVAETPAPEEAVAETPAPEEAVAETPAPEEAVAETPVPEEVVAETPAPEEVVAETPAPVEVVAETPAPEEVVAETPAPVEVVADTPAPEETEKAASSDEAATAEVSTPVLAEESAPAEVSAPEAVAADAVADNSNNNAVVPEVVVLPPVPEHAQYLLVGAGTAAFGAFRAIKAKDPKARILVVGEESNVPYMRPPLSKELWFNEDKEEVEKLQFRQWNGKKRSIFYEPNEFFADPSKLNTLENGGIALLKGKKVVKIDASKKKAWLGSGEVITYDKCLIATGGKPRNLPVFSKADMEVQKRTLLFRNADDFKALDSLTQSAGTVAVVGGGFLGSELACALGKRAKSTGSKVFQLYPENGNMGKVLPEYLSQWTTKKVENEGVSVMNNSTVTAADWEDGKVVLTTKDGNKVQADVVVCTVGLEPNTDLAKASGLETDPVHGGFLVNAELQARQDLWVAGDAACFFDIKLGRRRVEHHDHAVVSGRLAGENMAGAAKPYWHQSMFWSDLGPEVGYEAIGVCDASLPTTAVFAQRTAKDTPQAVVQATGESLRSETENAVEAGSPVVAEASGPADLSPDYGKGVVFYKRDGVVVGILLWNIFNRMGVARQVLKDGAKNEDLYEVAKLFDIYDTLAEEQKEATASS